MQLDGNLSLDENSTVYEEPSDVNAIPVIISYCPENADHSYTHGQNLKNLITVKRSNILLEAQSSY